MLATRQILEVAVKPDDCSVCTPAIGMVAMIAMVAVSWLLQENKTALHDKRSRRNLFVSRAASDIRASVGSGDAGAAAVFCLSQCHLM